MQSYAIGCTFRTGSNFLCEVLEQRGLGRPTEWFQTERYQNKTNVNSWQSLPPIDALYDEFASQSSNGWRGVKWSLGQFEVFRDSVRRLSSRTQSQWLPNLRWIRLRRLDAVGQAVSMYIAKHTDVWVTGDRGKASQELVYSFPRIWQLFCELLAEEAMWDGVFAEFGEEKPMCVWFEDLVSDPEFVAARVVRFLRHGEVGEVQYPQRISGFRSKSALSSQSGEFVERFRKDLRGGAHREVSDLLPRLREMLSSDTAGYSRSFMPLVRGHRGKGVTFRKCLPKMGRAEGAYVVTGEHFLEGEALKLDVGHSVAYQLEGARIRVDFLAHPWSGVAVIELGGVKVAEVDLYSVAEIVRPFQIEVANASVELVIRAEGGRNSLSQGGEVWVQRVCCIAFDSL